MTIARPRYLARSRHRSRGLTFLLAVSCGLIAANIYYAQPLIVSDQCGRRPAAIAAGLIVTMDADTVMAPACF